MSSGWFRYGKGPVDTEDNRVSQSVGATICTRTCDYRLDLRVPSARWEPLKHFVDDALHLLRIFPVVLGNMLDAPLSSPPHHFLHTVHYVYRQNAQRARRIG